jgi:hypothetical protein
MRRSILIIGAGIIACCLFACGPYGSYGYDYPTYGYAPYSWGMGNYLGYQPDIVVEHPWEQHWRDPGHHEYFHGPEGGFHGGGGESFHGNGGFHDGGGFHGAGGSGGGHR